MWVQFVIERWSFGAAPSPETSRVQWENSLAVYDHFAAVQVHHVCLL